MSTSDQEKEHWRQTFDKLRAHREARTELWGDVDDITLASYVDEMCSDEERRAVEEAMETKPAVRELVDFLRDVMRPVWGQPLASGAAALAPATEPVVAAGPRRSVLCDRLRVWLDNAGQLMADGAELLLGPPRPLPVPAYATVRTRGSSRPAMRSLGAETPAESESALDEYCWQIPVDELGYLLSVGFKRVAAPNRWRVRCDISSPGDPRIAERARFEIAQPNASPVRQSTLARLAGEYVEVASGKWEVTITVGDDVRVLPIELGSPPS